MDDDRQNPPEPGRPGRHRRGAVKVVAALLAGGSTAVAAAERSGVGVRTIERWRRKPAFRALVAQYRERVVDEALGYLSGLLARANAQLAGLLESSDEKTRLAAVRAVYDLFDRGHPADRQDGVAPAAGPAKVTEVTITTHAEAVEFAAWKARMEGEGKW